MVDSTHAKGEAPKPRVAVTKNGPYRVSGGLPLDRKRIILDTDGNPVAWSQGERYPEQENYRLCRCGESSNKPYCDGTHLAVGFDGTETAGHRDYEDQAKTYSGPDLELADAQELCANARFCHRAGGAWRLTRESDDSGKKDTAIEEACNCPSGRLVAKDKHTGEAIEPDLAPAASITDDPVNGGDGPIWLQGRVPVEAADGTEYEVRNRVTLCRCGKSSNKPFCDSSHVSRGLKDE